VIRDEEDLRRHIDYIHYNPVKHRHARCAADWPYSTFHRYVADGRLQSDWGVCVDAGLDAGER
jgi:putative transposase